MCIGTTFYFTGNCFENCFSSVAAGFLGAVWIGMGSMIIAYN